MLQSKWISSKGKYVESFEFKFSKYLNIKYATTTNSGTTAIELALKSLELNKNDEVLIPNLTFAASINAILNSGLKPRIIDTKKNSINTSLDIIKKNITKKVKAIVIVHLMGYSSDIKQISNYCRKNKIFLIEDVAESMGAKYESKFLGTFGDIGCFSFFANKIITTGEGGMCVTSKKSLYEKMNIIKSQGMSKKKNYWHDFVGSNYRMTNMQAAIGVVQLKKVKKIISMRRLVYSMYLKKLKKYDLYNLSIDFNIENSLNVPWQMLLKVEKNFRDDLIKYLNNLNIEAKVFFYPLSHMGIYKKYIFDKYLNSQDISYKLINLPMYPQMSNNEIDYVVNSIKKYMDT